MLIIYPVKVILIDEQHKIAVWGFCVLVDKPHKAVVFF